MCPRTGPTTRRKSRSGGRGRSIGLSRDDGEDSRPAAGKRPPTRDQFLSQNVSSAVIPSAGRFRVLRHRTGRKVAGASVKGKMTDDLAPPVERLAGKIAEAVREKGDTLVAKKAEPPDRVAALNNPMGKAKRPTLMVTVGERHVGLPTSDPAAETELAVLARGAGFDVIDNADGTTGAADVLIQGEGSSEFAGRARSSPSTDRRSAWSTSARRSLEIRLAGGRVHGRREAPSEAGQELTNKTRDGGVGGLSGEKVGINLPVRCVGRSMALASTTLRVVRSSRSVRVCDGFASRSHSGFRALTHQGGPGKIPPRGRDSRIPPHDRD